MQICYRPKATFTFYIFNIGFEVSEPKSLYILCYRGQFFLLSGKNINKAKI
jgi:hypothetical protein